MPDNGPFFIAGTGRSGTTRLSQILGEHPEVYSVSWESRFLIDPGGFEDLARVLTVDYTPLHSDDALRRLAYKLTRGLTGFNDNVLRGWGLAEEIGFDRYMKAVENLWQLLTWYEYDTAEPPLARRFTGWQYSPAEERSRHNMIGRYFTDRAELISILRGFTEEIFGGVASSVGKRTWCEKSPPGNLLSIPFLQELFPEATTIVIMRHPAGVAASYLDQPWTPSDIDGVLCFLEPIYSRWLVQRPALLKSDLYLEVKAEELADDWPASRSRFFGSLGLCDADTPSAFTPAALDHRDDQLTDEQMSRVTARLGHVISAMGYEPL